MNTLVNLVVSFVVFMVTTTMSFIGTFKGPIIIGALIGSVVLLFPAGAHAAEVGFFSPDIIEVCRPYGSISLEECTAIVEGIRLQRIIGVVLFVLIFVIAIPALLWWDYKEKVTYRNKYK